MTSNDLHISNAVPSLNVTNSYTKYKRQPSLLPWTFMFTRFSVFDLKWPLTSLKNKRILPLHMANLYIVYEKHLSLLPWHIMFTCYVSKTHAGQHYCKDSCLWQGINKHLNIVPPLFPYNFVWCLLETLFETKSLISIWQVSTITTKYILYVRFLENSFMMTAKVRFFVTNNDKSFKLHIYLWQPAMKSSWVQGKECFNWLPF